MTGAAMELLPARLRRRALAHPDRVAYRFFNGRQAQPETLTWRELDEAVETLAGVLAERGFKGERVLLACKGQRRFVVAFLACLAAGAVAVPTPLPRRQALQERLQLIADDAQAIAILVDGEELDALAPDSRVGALARLDLRDPSLHAAAAGTAARPEIAAQDIAFLQYTSGSTGDPKGVMVTHANIVANCTAIEQGMAMTPESSVLIALPLFHDMGLVGGVLQTIHVGCMTSLLPPAEFVQYPERWLGIVTRDRITIAGGPNFMFDLLARAARAAAGTAEFELSSLRVAFCGAEPIRHATLTQFRETFAACGFDPGALYPCYGMAESTLFITGTTPGEGARNSRHTGLDVIGCGHPRGATELRIVDPATRATLPDGDIGEIWTRGPSVAAGYWRRPELNRDLFDARPLDAPTTAFLRTGDLGYLLAGELHVCGRLKDLLIVNGRKFAPQDLEEAAESGHPGLRPSAAAAFAVQRDDREGAVLLCEVQRDWLRQPQDRADVIRAVRSAVNAAFGVVLADVALLRPGELPRTSSGKVRRTECRSRYLDGRFASDAELAG